MIMKPLSCTEANCLVLDTMLPPIIVKGTRQMFMSRLRTLAT